MSTISVKIDKKIYCDLQAFAFKRHRNFRCVRTELDEAVKQYLANQQDPEKED